MGHPIALFAATMVPFPRRSPHSISMHYRKELRFAALQPTLLQLIDSLPQWLDVAPIFCDRTRKRGEVPARKMAPFIGRSMAKCAVRLCCRSRATKVVSF